MWAWNALKFVVEVNDITLQRDSFFFLYIGGIARAKVVRGQCSNLIKKAKLK